MVSISFLEVDMEKHLRPIELRGTDFMIPLPKEGIDQVLSALTKCILTENIEL